MRELILLGLGTMLMACAPPNAPKAAPPPVSFAPKVASVEVLTDAPQRTVTVLSRDACKNDTLCALSGFCTAVGDECIAGSSGDCAASHQCSSDGACSASDGVCIAANDDQCKRSEACAREGRCRANDGYCSRG